MLILADEMLKKLAKWLRIFGVKTLFYEGLKDKELIKIAREKKAILLTRDEELYKIAKGKSIPAVFIEKEKINQQLIEVRKKLGLTYSFPEKSLCPKCGGRLKEISKEEIKDKVPDQVYKRHNLFWICEKCGKVYWEGSHWKNIIKRYEAVK